ALSRPWRPPWPPRARSRRTEPPGPDRRCGGRFPAGACPAASVRLPRLLGLGFRSSSRSSFVLSGKCRSEEHTSELQSRENLVSRRSLHAFPTRRSSDLLFRGLGVRLGLLVLALGGLNLRGQIGDAAGDFQPELVLPREFGFLGCWDLGFVRRLGHRSSFRVC